MLEFYNLMMDIRFCFIFISLVSVHAYILHTETPVDLKGSQVLKIKYDSEEQQAFVLQYRKLAGFEFIKIRSLPTDVDILVLAYQLPNFKRALESHAIQYKVEIEDFQEYLQVSFEELDHEYFIRKRRSRKYDFSYYPRYEEINAYLFEISEQNCNVSLFSIGKSFEGREIYGVKFSSGGNKTKPAILIDAGIHAREWIAPTTALYAISQLAMKSKKKFYKKVDWYILPLINPDGYEYSHTVDRMWRKTRSRNALTECVGVDINRNFGYEWDAREIYEKPCDSNYPGSKAFSEVETQNLRNFVLSKNGTIKTYISLHSYGQQILHPWGYTRKLPDNEGDLWYVAFGAEHVLSLVRGTSYTIGSSANLLFPEAGSSDDWMMAIGGASLAYRIELPGYSFVLNKNQIRPVGLETFEAFRIFAKYVEDNFTYQNSSHVPL